MAFVISDIESDLVTFYRRKNFADVDKTTYDSLNSTSRKSISNLDYEILENESKRNIILIEDVYAQQILEESRTLYG